MIDLRGAGVFRQCLIVLLHIQIDISPHQTVLHPVLIVPDCLCQVGKRLMKLLIVPVKESRLKLHLGNILYVRFPLDLLHQFPAQL